MAKVKKTHTEENLEIVEGALSKSEQFIEANSKLLSMVLGGIIVVVAIYFAYTRLYIAPKQDAAETEMFYAETYFEKDSFNLALNGDGNHEGFLYIMKEYGGTKAANLSHYYAGFCYLNLGEFQQAIDQLESFSGKEPMLSAMALGGLGDAYAEMGNKSKAISYYEDAAAIENEFTAPMFLFKAGLMYESDGKYQDAIDAYEKIHSDYALSTEGRTILKYIERAKLNL